MSIETLINHFKNIIQKEGLSAEDEALHLIAKAADGSCRDGLSLLDQAISLGSGEVKTDIVKNMIGITDRTAVFDIFESLVNGKTDQLMNLLNRQHEDGVNPVILLQDLISITHLVAKIKIVPEFINDVSLSENEKEFASKIAPLVPMAVLSKIWQMLIKGLNEINIAPLQQDALDMILIRIAYSSNLPTPAEILDGLKKNSDLSPNASNVSHNPPELMDKKEPSPDDNGLVFNTPEELVGYLAAQKQLMLAYGLKHDVSFSEFSHGNMKVAADSKINRDFWVALQSFLEKNTHQKWIIDVTDSPLGQTIADKEELKTMAYQKDALELPLVKAIMAEFAGAKIDSLVRKIQNETNEETDFVDYNNYMEDEN